MNKDYLTTEEVASYLGVSEETVRRYIKTEKIQATKFGKSYYIPKEELERLFKETDGEKKEPPKPPKPPHEDRLVPFKPGINSMIAETMSDLAKEMRDVSEIESLVRDLDGDSITIFEQVKKQGIEDPIEFIKEFVRLDAEKTEAAHKEIKEYLENGNIAIFLPLPPPVIHPIEKDIGADTLFKTDDKVPKHIEKLPFTNVTMDNLAEVTSLVHEKHAVVLDGQSFGKKLIVRPTMENVLKSLLEKNLKKIYFHRIPHIPKGQQFTTVDISSYPHIELVTL